MATLILTFSDIYNEVLKLAGQYNSGSPSATALTDAKFIVNRAYLRFVNAHDWTFLRGQEKITTESGKWIYELPTDFGYMAPDKFVFSADDSYPPTQSRSLAWIQNQRAGMDWTSYPEFHVIFAGPYTKEVGQRWQAGFYPTPNSEWKLNFSYRISPQKLEANADIPIGGPEASDVLLELALAYTEAYKDETYNVHEQKIQEILSPLISLDNKRRPKFLGTLAREGTRPQYGEVLETGITTFIT